MAYVQDITQKNAVSGSQNIPVKPSLTHHGISIECATPSVTFALTRTVVGLSATLPVEDGIITANTSATFQLPGSTQLIIAPSDPAAAFSLSVSSF